MNTFGGMEQHRNQVALALLGLLASIAAIGVSIVIDQMPDRVGWWLLLGGAIGVVVVLLWLLSLTVKIPAFRVVWWRKRGIRSATEQSVDTPHYRVSLWAGKHPNYECAYCPFADLRKGQMVDHLVLRHGIEVSMDEIGGLEAKRDDYSKSLKKLELGDLSIYPPGEQLQKARGNFHQVVAAAEAGEVDSRAVEKAKATFLKKSRAYNASGPNYVADFRIVEDALKRLSRQSVPNNEAPHRPEDE